MTNPTELINVKIAVKVDVKIFCEDERDCHIFRTVYVVRRVPYLMRRICKRA